MRAPVITSLAILKVNWDRNHTGYLENFLPFVCESLRLSQENEVSLPALQESILTLFGIKIPQSALKTILHHAKKRNYVIHDMGIYKRNKEKLSKKNISKLRAEAERKHRSLINKLIEFASARHGQALSASEAEDILLNFIEEHSIPILLAAVEGQPIPLTIKPSRKMSYIANSYVKNLSENDPEGFECLETVVKGKMLSDVLLFPEPADVERHFDKVEIYLDTQVVLRALGYANSSLQDLAKELLEILYEENARLCIFEHNYEEVRNILERCYRALSGASKIGAALGETAEYFITNDYRSSDLETIIADLDKNLKALRIEIKATPAHTIPLGLDEKKFEEALQRAVHYKNPDTLKPDLDSLTSIHRLRGGKTYRNIESCRALFVTMNDRLAWASAQYFKEEFPDVSLPHCVLAHIIATLLWLKKPSEGKNLPRKTLLANCYAALNPPDQLWKNYLDQIKRMQDTDKITKNDYYTLRFQISARSTLMDLTYGESESFTEGTITEILERVKKETTASLEKQLEEELQKRRETERQLQEIENTDILRIRARCSRIERVSVRIGIFVSKTLYFISIPVLIIGTYFMLPSDLWVGHQGAARFVVVASVLVVYVLSVLALARSSTLLIFVRKIEVFVARKIGLLLEWFYRKIDNFAK